jgi:hypothetical protein
MTTNHDDERLDAFLSQWADQSASPDGLDDLHDRIVMAAVETGWGETETGGRMVQRSNGSDDPVGVIYPRGFHMRRSWTIGLTVSSAVMVLVAMTFYWLTLQNLPDGGPGWEVADVPPDYAWLREDQIQNKAVLLAEMEDVFDRQLAWLAETGDRIEFGLDRSAAGETEQLPSDATRLAVRVVVERRPQGSTDWQLAWAVDVVSRSEEVVRVAPRGADGNELRLWTYQLPDGLIAIDSELHLAGRDQFHATTSGLQQDRQPVQVLTTRDKGTEYRIFQTVAVLDGKVS